MIVEILDAKREGHKSSGKFSISSVDSCFRKKYFEMKGEYKEEFDAKTLRTFSIGDMFHQTVCKEIFEKGQQHNIHVVAAEVNVPEQKYFSGRADIILSNSLTGEKFIVDVKSCGDWTFNNVLKGECPQNYQDQLQLYLHFFGIQKGYLVFVNKARSTVTEFEVVYDKAKCLTLVRDVENFFINNVDKNIAPPKCSGGDFGCPVCESSL